MARSKLVDRGEETATLFPEIRVENRRGQVYKTPANEGRTIRVTVAEDRQSLAEIPGQLDVKVVRLIFRWPHEDAIGTGSRVLFRNEEWDLQEPPHYSSGASRAMRHVEILIKSRNQLGGQE